MVVLSVSAPDRGSPFLSLGAVELTDKEDQDKDHNLAAYILSPSLV